MYSITRDGFALLAMGFTGRKALAWKLKFIAAFNAMEAKLLDDLKRHEEFTGKFRIQGRSYWFKKYPRWASIHAGVIHSIPLSSIAERAGCRTQTVRRAIRRMIEVGILHPLWVEYAFGKTRFALSIRGSNLHAGWGRV